MSTQHADHAHGQGREQDHDHDHIHDHATHRHPPAQPDDTSPPGRYELMILAMRDLLIEKGILTADQIRRGLEKLDAWQPSRGAEIVARINKEMVASLAKPAVRDLMLNQGFVPRSSTPEALAAYMKEQLAVWKTALKAAGVEPQ